VEAGGEVAQGNRPNTLAPELKHGIPYFLEHAAHLPVSAFVHGQSQPRTVVFSIEHIDHCRSGGPPLAFEQHAFPQRRYRIVSDPSLYDGNVFLFHPVTRVEDAMGERAVIGEEQRPRSLPIETPHRKHARAGGNELEHGRAAFGITGGGHDPFGFVEQVVGVTLGQSRRAAIHDHPVSSRLDERG